MLIEPGIYNFFKTFEKEVNMDIGLKFTILFLSPFLNISLISAYFSLEGKVPVESILLQI
jgi:hypothetical protein